MEKLCGDFLNKFMHYVHDAIYKFAYTFPHTFHIYSQYISFVNRAHR